jgi:hypothetical protein
MMKLFIVCVLLLALMSLAIASPWPRGETLAFMGGLGVGAVLGALGVLLYLSSDEDDVEKSSKSERKRPR